jgi:hypothetical protein
MSPITSLTPLQTSFGNPSSELTFVGDLTPILPEEMPPSDFFFSKKRKAIVKENLTKRMELSLKGKDWCMMGKTMMVQSLQKKLQVH